MKPTLFRNDDNPAVLAEIHVSAFTQAWSLRAVTELLASPGAFAFVTTAGFILTRVAASEAEILTLAVRPGSRRRGAGIALVLAAADHACSLGAAVIFLEVAVSNDAARNLYSGLGFSEVGRRTGYYGAAQDKREDAMILRSDLPLAPLGKRSASG